MSQFSQPLLGAAPPFVALNPGGVDPDQAIDTLARVRQGELQRAHERSMQTQQLATQVQEEANERAFRAEAHDKNIAADAEHQRRELEDRKFERESQERSSAETLRLDEELATLDEQEEVAVRESAAEMVAAIRERRREIEARMVQLEGQSTKLNALMVSRKALLEDGDPAMVGHLYGHVDDALEAKRQLLDSFTRKLDSSFLSLNDYFTDAPKDTLPLDKKLPGEMPMRDDTGAVFHQGHGGKETILSLMGLTDGGAEPDRYLKSPLQGVADAVAELAGASDPASRFAIDDLMRNLVRAQAGESGAEERAAQLYQQMILSKEEGGMGLDNERLSMGLRAVSEKMLGREKAVDAKVTQRDLQEGEGAVELPKGAKEAAKEVTAQMRMIGDGLSRFSRLRSAEGKVLAAPERAELPEQTIRDALLSAVQTVAGAEDLEDLYRRLQDDDPTNDPEVEGALGAEVLTKLPPETRAAMRRTIATQLGTLMERQEFKALSGDMPGRKLSVADKDALEGMIRDQQVSLDKIKDEEEKNSTDRITQIRKRGVQSRREARSASARRRNPSLEGEER